MPRVSTHRSATVGSGLAWGLIGVLAFSFTVPFTRIAVRGLSPLFLGSARAVFATVLAIAALALTRQQLPRGAQWTRIAVVGGGIVLGFPLLTSFALVTVPAGHGAVVIAVLPAVTAVVAVLRAGERPARGFWIAATFGTITSIAFAVIQDGGLAHLHRADLLLFGAVLAGAIGYAEGGMLARELGPWQTVSWALVVCAPVMLVLTVVAVVHGRPQATPAEWFSLAYLGAVSAYLGFFAWYRGLAIGPMSRVSQVQLVQPVMTLAWAALLLNEHITASTITGGIAVVAAAAVASRTRRR